MAKMSLDTAMSEVHRNIPKSVTKTGKTGREKQKMLAAIAYSKAGQSRKK